LTRGLGGMGKIPGRNGLIEVVHTEKLNLAALS